MIKVLYTNGKEIICSGRVKFHMGSQPAFCHYDLNIDNKKYNMQELKLVYDYETNECVYFTENSYGFHMGDKYEELYNESLEELKERNDKMNYIENIINEIKCAVNDNEIKEILFGVYIATQRDSSIRKQFDKEIENNIIKRK